MFLTQAAESAAAIAKAGASAALEAEAKHTSEDTSRSVTRNDLEVKTLRGTEPLDVEGAAKAQGQMGKKGLTKKVGFASREGPVTQSVQFSFGSKQRSVYMFQTMSAEKHDISTSMTVDGIGDQGKLSTMLATMVGYRFLFTCRQYFVSITCVGPI